MLHVSKGLLIIVVESVEKRRQPQKMEAIYLLAPSLYSVECFIKDFDASLNGGKTMYSNAHLFFTAGI